MDPAQRYASYSLEDLRDVERHINREKFPQTYAALMAEIERREAGVPQVLEAPPKPEPSWHATVRQVYSAVFTATIALCIIGAMILLAVPVAHAFALVHAAPAATATQTVPIRTGQGREHRVVYITPGENARLEGMVSFGTFGFRTMMPIVLVLGLVAHGLGIRIFDPPKKDATPDCASAPGTA